MSRVSLQNGGGPGSSISLAPETIKVRNALIEKFTDEPLDEMNHFMNTALAAETNELRRIGIWLHASFCYGRVSPISKTLTVTRH